MPANTFLNLPDAKRNRIIEVALKEFAQNDFRNASVTRMVRILGIAKGSVYQYFKNKQDLYLYLLELAEEHRNRFIWPFVNEKGTNFVKWYRKYLFGIILFNLNFPLYGAFLKNVSREEHTAELGNLLLKRKRERIDFFRKQLMDRVDGKKAPSSEELQHIAFFLTQLEEGVFDYMIIHLDLDDKISGGSGVPVEDLPEDQIKATLKTLTSVLKGSLPVK